jgi:RNA polymerase sigma-70 factor (ECF subfamily)
MNMIDWPTTRVTLLSGLQAGENPTGSWNDFVSIYGPVVMQVCQDHEVQDPDASDIAQEVFVRVYKGITDFEYTPETGSSFGNWVGRITRNEIFRFLSKTDRRVKREAKAAINPIVDDERDFAIRWERGERFAFTMLAIKTLRERYDPLSWALFEDRVLKGMKPADVAKKHGVDADRVYRAAYRIGTRIAELVNEMLQDDKSAESFS